MKNSLIDSENGAAIIDDRAQSNAMPPMEHNKPWLHFRKYNQNCKQHPETFPHTPTLATAFGETDR